MENTGCCGTEHFGSQVSSPETWYAFIHLWLGIFCLRSDHSLQLINMLDHFCGTVHATGCRRPGIAFARLDPPPDREQDGQATPDGRAPVHGLGVHGERERKAVDDEPQHHVPASNEAHNEAEGTLHVERAVDDVLPGGQEVREDGGNVA
jgi:hypothetical protein